MRRARLVAQQLRRGNEKFSSFAAERVTLNRALCYNFSETTMARDYVQRHEKGYRIASTRVSLDSIVYAYIEGLRPASIADDFPALSLEEAYVAIAYNRKSRRIR